MALFKTLILTNYFLKCTIWLNFITFVKTSTYMCLPLIKNVMAHVCKTKNFYDSCTCKVWHIPSAIVWHIPSAIWFQVFDFELSAEDVMKIKALDQNLRVFKEPM